jgi:hypothetical protein
VVCLAWSEDWRLVSSRGVLKMFGAGIPAAQAYIGKLIFDTLSAGYGSGHSYVWYTVLGYLLLEGLLFAARTALHSAGRLVDANLNHVLRFSIMRQIMEHAAKLDLSSYERKYFHERV